MKGIYKIENEKTGRVYIGQSSDLQKRLNKHNNDLISNKHDNKFLQEDWNRGDEFSYTILEFTEDLNNRENYWMNQHDNTYNIKINRVNEKKRFDLELGVKYYFNTKKKRDYEVPFKRLVNQLRRGAIKDEDKIKLFEKYDFLPEAIEYLGFKGIEYFNFVKDRIIKGIELEKKKIEYKEYILESMETKVGDLWDIDELNNKLQSIYDELDLGKIRLNERNRYYEFMRTQRTTNKVRVRGHLITKII